MRTAAMLPLVGDLDPRQITPATVTGLVARLKLKLSSIRRYMDTLRALLDYAASTRTRRGSRVGCPGRSVAGRTADRREVEAIIATASPVAARVQDPRRDGDARRRTPRPRMARRRRGRQPLPNPRREDRPRRAVGSVPADLMVEISSVDTARRSDARATRVPWCDAGRCQERDDAGLHSSSGRPLPPARPPPPLRVVQIARGSRSTNLAAQLGTPGRA